MRRPISRVRSVTDTSMMFMMPTPPTTSEISRHHEQQPLISVDGRRQRLGHLGHVADVEVVRLAGLDVVPLVQQLGDLPNRRWGSPSVEAARARI